MGGQGHNGGLSGEGVKNQNVEDISSQQIDTGPLIPGFFFFFPFLLDMICIANGGPVALAFFWSQEKLGKGEIGGSHNTQALL